MLRLSTSGYPTRLLEGPGQHGCGTSRTADAYSGQPLAQSSVCTASSALGQGRYRSLDASALCRRNSCQHLPPAPARTARRWARHRPAGHWLGRGFAGCTGRWRRGSGDGGRRDRPDLLMPVEPTLDQLGDGPRGAPAMLATVHLLQEFRLHLLGFAVGCLVCPGTWRLTHCLLPVSGSWSAYTCTFRPSRRCGSRRHP
jgi:hypothetical protein